MIDLSQYLTEMISNKTTGKYRNADQEDPDTWDVGDILAGTAGWSMNLPRFYKITKRTSKQFTCVRLKGKIVSGHKNGQWTEVATDEVIPGEEYKARITKYGALKIDDTYVRLWDGKPLHGDDMD